MLYGNECDNDCIFGNTTACKYCSYNPNGVYKDEQFSYVIKADGYKSNLFYVKNGVVPFWKFKK